MTLLCNIFIDKLRVALRVSTKCDFCLNTDVIFHYNIHCEMTYTFTFESHSQHHARRALKPLGTIVLLSSITCREFETSMLRSFKLTLPPPFSPRLFLQSSTREEENQKKTDLLHYLEETFCANRKEYVIEESINIY